MLHENTMVRNAAADLQQIFMSENPDATAVEAAFDKFGQAIAASVLADYQSANGDRAILAQRGFRQLTSEETKYYCGSN